MPAPSPQTPGLLNWALIVALGVIWGAAFMAIRISLDGFGPLTVAAGRTGLGALVLLAAGAAMGQGLDRLSSLSAWRSAAAVGVIGVAVPFVLLAWGQQHVPSAFAGVAMGAVPLMVVPLVALFSPDEGLGPRRIAGVLLGFVGLLLLIGQGAFEDAGQQLETAGRLACLGAAMCYGISSIVTRRSPKVPPIAFATAMLLVASGLLVPLALIREGVPQALAPRPALALTYAAVFPTALAAIIRVRVITTAGSLFMSLTSYMVPVWSVILGVAVLGEALPPQLFYALALILAGIALSQWSALRRGRPSA